MKVLERVTDASHCAGVDLLKFDNGNQSFKIVPLNPTNGRSLKHQLAWGNSLNELNAESRTQLTLSDAQSICDTLYDACPKLEGCEKKDSYVRKWLNRCAVDWICLCHKIAALDVKNVTVREYLKLPFPDQKEMVMPLLTMEGMSQKQAEGKKLTDAWKALKYCGKPQHFHMFACFAADDELKAVIRVKSGDWIARHKTSMVRWATDYFKKHGFNPHVRQVVQAHAHLT